MDKLKAKTRDLARGRNGMDQLNMALQVLSIPPLVLGLLTRSNPWIYGALVLMVLVNFRAYSRNIPRRQAENRKFLALISPLSRALRIGRRQAQERKTHRYLPCPQCRNILRLPKGKGKIRISCPKCGHKFEKRV